MLLCAQHATGGFIGVRTLELGTFRPEFGARPRKRGYESTFGRPPETAPYSKPQANLNVSTTAPVEMRGRAL
jgi:hypothetical protein